MTTDADVIVVGAGLAGLQCAQSLRGQGRAVLVLEADKRVGGRVQTDLVDGFRCDRGFQLLNPAYPAVRRHVDVAALDLRFFGRGVVSVGDDGPRLLADPVRHPRLLATTLRSGLLRPGELARLARWLAPAMGPVERLVAGPDASLRDSLAAPGIDGPLRRGVLDPFLTGVLGEGSGATSAAFVRLLLRSFLRSTPGIPAWGMQQLPDQLAAGLDVRVNTAALRISDAAQPRVETADGVLGARVVVVATDPTGSADLTPLPRPVMNGLATWWFRADRVGDHPGFLRVDGRGTSHGPVVNTAVLSAAAPTYAPDGQHLVAATTLLPCDGRESDVRRHLGELHGVDVAAWQLVIRHEIPHALPAQPPPLELRRPVRLGGRIFVAGDHRDTASIQGALASGARVASAVEQQLASA